MKVLIHWWEMGAFPVTIPFREGEDDPRRAIEVPDDLHERFVEAHEEFCAVLSEIDVQCVEIRDAPSPYPVGLLWGRHYPEGRYSGGAPVEGYAARCEVCGQEKVVAACRPSGPAERDAVSAVLSRGWRERRHGGLACPTCAPREILLPTPGRSRGTPDSGTGTVAEDDRRLGAGGDGGILTGEDAAVERSEEAP